MDNLYLDYEQGIILGNEIKDGAHKFNILLDKIYEIEEKLNNELGNKIDKNIRKELLTRAKIMDKLGELIDETGNFLVNVSSAYQECATVSCDTKRGD